MNARARNKTGEMEREERTFLKVHRPKDHRQLGAEGRETIKEKKKGKSKRKQKEKIEEAKEKREEKLRKREKRKQRKGKEISLCSNEGGENAKATGSRGRGGDAKKETVKAEYSFFFLCSVLKNRKYNLHT